jgi:hypothetical protein
MNGHSTIPTAPVVTLEALGGATFKANGLALPEALTRDQWANLREVLSVVEGAPLWWWGDWLAYGQERWKTDYGLALERSGYKYKTLREACYVARSVELSIRMDNLGWHHHQLVAALKDKDRQRYWLGRAAREGWTVAEMRFHMKQGDEETPEPHRIHYSSAEDEWYTPPEVVAAVVGFFGTVDLDPCCEDADDPTVPATVRYTEDDDGLSKDWQGRVYMNPPYGDAIGQWVTKLHAHYQAGDIEAGIALVPARTDTQWFRHFRNYAVCFVNGRLHFSGNEDSAPFPSALVYLGDEIDRYAATVAHLGDVWTRRQVEAQ